MRLDISFVLGVLKLLKKFSLHLQRANLRVDEYYHLLELLKYSFESTFKVLPMTPAAQSYLEVYNNILAEPLMDPWYRTTQSRNWTLKQER